MWTGSWRARAGRGAVLGSELSSDNRLFQKIIENKTPVVLALDRDALAKTFNIAKALLEYDIKVKLLDLNKDHQGDVGDLTRTEFNELLDRAKIFGREDLLRRKIAGIV